MNKKTLNIPMNDDGYIEVFEDLSEIKSYPINQFFTETFKDKVVNIIIGNDVISLPASYEVLQTEETELDFIPCGDLLPIPLFSTDGKFAINSVGNYHIEYEEEVEWVTMCIPKGNYFIMEGGLVVNPYPQQRASMKIKDVEL